MKNKNEIKESNLSQVKKKYQDKIIQHFDKLAKSRTGWIKKANGFYKEDILMMRELVPEGSSVLEIGSGNGHLLSALKPSYGVGIDISYEMTKIAKNKYEDLTFIQGNIDDLNSLKQIKNQFDFIILSDTVGYFYDIENTFNILHSYCKADTRLIVAYYSPYWEPFLNIASFLRLKMPEISKALLNEEDISTLLKSSGYETVRKEKKILFPFRFLGISRFLNKFLSPLPLLSSLCLRHYVISRSLRKITEELPTSASVVIPCKNEKGNIRKALDNLPIFTNAIEVIFVEGHSQDGTWDEIQKVIKEKKYKEKNFDIIAIQQSGKGKANAVFEAFDIASNDVLIILDGDLTVSPADISKFWKKIASGEAEYINGTRLLYPMERSAMFFLNYIANRFFSLLFSWLLGQRYTDTLCGTKVLQRKHYKKISERNKELGPFDPFGDFFIIFGASRLNLKMMEVPIHYRARTYGQTQISRFSHGFLLIKMVLVAFLRIKAI